MVDFKKHLASKKVQKQVDPVALYDTLDRAVDKGPLRPAQEAVLADWFVNHKTTRDVIVKLHTGQGKTLVGLLMLQSRLNASGGPAVYLCFDKFLIDQTCEQAKQFGIATCEASPDLPDAFHNGERILVTSVQKLFNGLTRFGIGNKSVSVGCLLMDDSHACSDIIRDACRIRIPKEEPAYAQIRALFSAELEQQGVGTYADISNDKRDAFLPIPYWAWTQHESQVASILSTHSATSSIKYAWPLLKDMLTFCQGVISGVAVESEPYVPPLSMFGSYWLATHRIFMSATVTDDAFLVKGLQLNPDTILKPLTYPKERWSGEKMVLIPSLIDECLDRREIVNAYGPQNVKRTSGVVAIAPGFNWTKDWEKCGALVANKDNVAQSIELLRQGHYDETIVLVNRYDGIDLPDDTCRILIFDSGPYSESLIDLYQEACRPNSEATLMRTIRTVEQGMGRSVRGEKDYSVIIVVGTDITRLIRDKKSRRFLSPQMATQVEIGLEIAEMARKEIDEGESAALALSGLIKQCLGRDDGWKAFYSEQMDKVVPSGANEGLLKIYAVELEAERSVLSGDYAVAANKLQGLLDQQKFDSEDKAWYLQEMARYNYRANRPESQRLQIAAYKMNRFLLEPATGVTVAQLTLVSQGRMERIIDWVKKFENYQQLEVTLSDILGQLVFGTKADPFEQALDEISFALGFVGERPDKEWKEGPDNLWALNDKQYILWECKSEVDIKRAEINKREAEQMNRSCAWFDKHYAGMEVKRLMVHPAYVVASSAALTHESEVVRETELKRFVKQIRVFFKGFEALDFNDLSVAHVQKLVDSHNLSIPEILGNYSKKVKNAK